MEDLPIGSKITLKVIETEGCDDCFFGGQNWIKNYLRGGLKQHLFLVKAASSQKQGMLARLDGTNVIFKEVKE